MDIKDIKALIKAVTDTDITEFEIKNGEETLLIKRGKEQEVVHVAAPPAYAPPAPQPGPAAAPAQPGPAPAAETETAAEEAEGKYELITSPIVGTFYRAPSPDSDPYVEVGQTVESGQVFCIVEAMKLMNEIEAEFKCRVVEILKENAQPVEFGDALFKVEPL